MRERVAGSCMLRGGLRKLLGVALPPQVACLYVLPTALAQQKCPPDVMDVIIPPASVGCKLQIPTDPLQLWKATGLRQG